MTYVAEALRRIVEKRASFCCEYCTLATNISFYPHEVDHVIALKHGGKTDAENLAYACWRCNRHKGSDLGSFDPQTKHFSFLFNPREQEWAEHFAMEGDLIAGLTPEGRTTAHLLQFNLNERVAERQRAGNVSL